MRRFVAVVTMLIVSVTIAAGESAVTRKTSEHREFTVGSFYKWSETNGVSVGHNLSWWWDDGVRDENLGKTHKIYTNIKTLQLCYSKSTCYNLGGWGGCEPSISQCVDVTNSGSFESGRNRHSFVGGGYRLECDNESLVSMTTGLNKNKNTNGYLSVEKVVSTNISAEKNGCVLYLPDGSGLVGNGWLSYGSTSSKTHDPNFSPSQPPYPTDGGKG